MKCIQILFVALLIQVCSIHNAHSKIDTLWVKSQSMNKAIPNLVVTPSHYDADQKKYPVLYLLHGAGGSFMQWLGIEPELQRYADQYAMLIVCADGGKTSWYFDSPVDETMKFETYITKELVTRVDEAFRTRPDKSGRAITGLSMGGHGAFYLAIRHPELWGAAGSTSGGLDFRAFPNNWDLAKRLGPYTDRQENWEKHTVINMIDAVKGRSTQLFFDCGVDDFFLDANRRTHLKFLELNIPHTYTEMPGKHNAAYWKNSLPYHFVFFAKFFNPE